MISKKLTEEQREFYAELSEKFNDTVQSIEMICFEGSQSLFEGLGLKLPPGRKNLWGIIAYGEKGLHIYVNPTETTILGFKVGNQKKAPKEQLFSFDNFTSWNVEQPVKKILWFSMLEKYSLLLHIEQTMPTNESVRGTFLLQTQTLAKETLAKMNKYKK